MTNVIPGPRPAQGQARPDAVRDGGHAALLPAAGPRIAHNRSVHPTTTDGAGCSPVALTRTPRGWSVVSPGGTEEVGGLVEGLSLADLVAEEFGALAEPDRTTRRSARGPGGTPEEIADPVDARITALERTVAQLEHALAARVATERAIGVLAERNRTDPRAAFETLRRDARSQGRPVAELAHEVLEELIARAAAVAEGADAPVGPIAVVAPLPRIGRHADAKTVPVTLDGRS
jgi:hypothetical protein